MTHLDMLAEDMTKIASLAAGKAAMIRELASKEDQYTSHKMVQVLDEIIMVARNGRNMASGVARMYFIYLADQLVRRGRRDAAMDDLFDHIDAFMRAGDFVTLNMILQSLHPCTLELDTVLGILTASLPARKELPSRTKFFEAAKQSFPTEDPALFAGLE